MSVPAHPQAVGLGGVGQAANTREEEDLTQSRKVAKGGWRWGINHRDHKEHEGGKKKDEL